MTSNRFGFGTDAEATLRERPLRYEFLLLSLATIVGVLLRCWTFGHGIWRDEASTYFDAVGGTWQSVILRVAHSELNPPGYFLFMHYWLQWVPTTDQLLKLPSLLASMALIPLGALVGWHIGGQRVGVLAAWIMAIAPMNLYYSQEARPYMFAAVFTLIGVLGILQLIDAPRAKRGIILLAIGTIGAALMQYTGGIFAIVLLGAWSYVRAKGWMSSRIAPVAIVGLFLLLLAAWLFPDIIAQAHSGLSWNEHTSPLAYPEEAIRNLLVTLPLDWLPRHELMKALFLALIAVDLLITMKQKIVLTPPGGRNGVLLLGILAAIAVLETPISNHGRYMVAFAPIAWLCIAAWLLRGFGRNIRRSQLGNGFAMLFVIVILAYDAQTLWQDQGIVKSGAARLTNAQSAQVLGNVATWSNSGTRLVVVPDFLAPSVAYYLRDTAPTIYGFARWSQPQQFSPLGYADLWNDPQAVTITQQHIAALRSSGVRRLILISMPSQASGSLPYDKGETLVAALRAQYHRSGPTLRLLGKYETLTVDELRL